MKLGYNLDEVKSQLTKAGSHISMLYQKMLADKKAIMTPIAPSFVPSILSTLSPTSATALDNSFKNGACN